MFIIQNTEYRTFIAQEITNFTIWERVVISEN